MTHRDSRQLLRRCEVAWLAALVVGCASDGPDYEPIKPAVPEVIEFEAPESVGSQLGGDADFARQALEEFSKSGNAPIVRRPGFVLWPFGEIYPVLHCKPLRVCDIELQAGEQVLSVAFGDTTRWISQLVESGVGGTVPHLLVKPREYGIDTNVVIMTNRRTYHIGLIARKDSKGEYVRNARFYYPREAIAAWNRAARQEREGMGLLGRLFGEEAPEISDASALNFGYEIAHKGRKAPSWMPLVAYDDGARTFIQFPEAVAVGRGGRAPVIFEGGDSKKKRAIRNYRIRDDLAVVDGLLDRALLVLGEEQVTITAKSSANNRRPRRFGKRR